MAHPACLAGRRYGHILLEDAGSIIHRAALATGEGEDAGVPRIDLCLVFVAHRTLIAYHIGPGTAKPGGTDGLVGIYHYVMLRRLFYAVKVMVDYALAVVVLAVGYYPAHITALDSIVAISFH